MNLRSPFCILQVFNLSLEAFFYSTYTRDPLEKSNCILFPFRESAYRIFAPFPSNVAEREPLINLEMDHPAP